MPAARDSGAGSWVANARMYAPAPDILVIWERLFAVLARRSGVGLHALRTAPESDIRQLWARHDLGCVFMCGLQTARHREAVVPLAAPRPLAGPGEAAPVYRSVFVARRGVARLDAVRGGTIALMPSHSYSGFVAPLAALADWYPDAVAGLFAGAVRVETPRAAIAAVADGRADVAPIDSYFWALAEAAAPGLTAGLNAVAWTASAPAPPLVASRGVPEAARAALAESLQALGDEQVGEDLLAALGLAGFAAVTPASYDRLAASASWVDAHLAPGGAVPWPAA